MSLRQTKISGSLFRTFAAGTLLVWLSALAFCAELCSSAGNITDSDTPHCHADADAHHHHDQAPAPSHHGPCGSTSCQTLQNALIGSKAATALHPDLVPLYALPVFGLTFDTADAESHLAFRHAKPRDWVFTPEVCLGPAFRSLPPPLV